MAKRHHKRYINELISHIEPTSVMAEAYRSLRTNIQFTSVENPVRTVLITSAGPREGKTTTLVNIGITMAQTGSRVILFDTDLRRPMLHKIFSLPNATGLSNALVEFKNIELIAANTSVPNLYVAMSGPVPPNPAELLIAPNMGLIIEDAKKKFDVVLLDSPPLLSVTDALILGKYTDGIILVVQGSRTIKEAAARATEVVKEHKLKIIGAVLNDVNLARENYDYYFYYGYYGKSKKYGYAEVESTKRSGDLTKI